MNARGLQSPGSASLQTFNGTDVSLDEVPTMHAFAIGISLEAKVLVRDDISAIIRTYPGAGAAADFGAISGSVTSAEGTPLLGASIIAYRANPGDNTRSEETGVIIGANTDLAGNLNGDYRIDFLLPGDYIVRLLPLDGSVESASVGVDRIDGYLEGIIPLTGPFDFEEQFARDLLDPLAVTLDESQAQAVTVIAGQENVNIDFTQVLVDGSGGPTGGGAISGPAMPIILGDTSGCSSLGAPVSAVNALGQLFFLLAPLGFTTLWKRKKFALKK